MVHIPYKVSSDLLSDMVTGRVEAAFVPTAFVLSLLRDDKLQALAVAATEPQIDPFPARRRVRRASITSTPRGYGFLAPAKTPQDVLDKLAAAFSAAADDSEVQAKVRAQGLIPKVKTRAAFDAHIREDTKTLAPLIQDIASNTRN